MLPTRIPDQSGKRTSRGPIIKCISHEITRPNAISYGCSQLRRIAHRGMKWHPFGTKCPGESKIQNSLSLSILFIPTFSYSPLFHLCMTRIPISFFVIKTRTWWGLEGLAFSGKGKGKVFGTIENWRKCL